MQVGSYIYTASWFMLKKLISLIYIFFSMFFLLMNFVVIYSLSHHMLVFEPHQALCPAARVCNLDSLECQLEFSL